MHMMGLPAMVKSVRGLQEESLENVCFALEDSRVLHAVKEVISGFLPQNKADGIDNTSDNLNPSFCHGGFQRC